MSASPVRVKPPQILPADDDGVADEVIRLEDLLASEKQAAEPAPPNAHDRLVEIGGRRDGPDPTRYGDWEKNGRCIDF